MATNTSVTASTTTMASENTHSSLTLAGEDRKLMRRFLVDLLVFILIVLPIVICEVVIKPFRRGFFCNDETLRYPFRRQTVSNLMLGLLVGVLPFMTITLVELFCFCRRGRMHEVFFLFGCKTRTWLIECGRQLFYYTVGLVLTLDATEVGKYTIGRLRPFFLAVCQPKLADGSTCADLQNQQRYIEDYYCEASGYTALDVIESRRSFPSGHSSLAFYAMLYLGIYFHYRLSRRGSKLMRQFLQFVAAMLAWFTALTRVADNWHHWSDVLVGILIGIVGAWLTARFIAKFKRRHSSCDSLLHVHAAASGNII